MKKIFSFVLAAALALSVCACSKMPEDYSEPAESAEPISGVANPMQDATLESLAADMGVDFSMLAGYENVKCFKINGDPVVAEVSYTFEGDEYTFRLALTAAEQDISGMYYTWTESSEAEVGYCTAKVNVAAEGAGVIAWYDAVPGVMYSVSMSANATAEKLAAMANKLFVPTQGESEGDFEIALGELLADMHGTYFPGSAGSSINGFTYSAKLADLFAEGAGLYADSAEFIALVAKELNAYIADNLTESADRTNFAQQIFGISGSYDYLAEGNISALADGGYESAAYPWDDTVVGAAFDAMTDVIYTVAYAEPLGRYYTAFSEKWDGEKLNAEGMEPMLIDLMAENGLDSIGFSFIDLDKDGYKELVIGAISDNEFFKNMVLELYWLDMEGNASQVCKGWERNRYYYAGEGLFAHQGSSGADDSFDTTEIFQNGNLNDLGYTTSEFVSIELTPFSAYNK